MWNHLFRLVWNRKRENTLIIIELLAAFAVVFFIFAQAAYYWNLYDQPLGFDYDNGYAIQVSTSGEWSEEDGRTLDQTLLALRAEPELAWAHAIAIPVFRNMRWTNSFEYSGKSVGALQNTLTAGGPEDLGVQLLDGRWFATEDLGSGEDRVVINQHLATELFGNESPLGKAIVQPRADSDSPAITVVGVFEDFRHRGEFSEPDSYIIGQHDLAGADRIGAILVRFTADTPSAYEQELQQLVQNVAPDWKVRVTALEKMRREMLRGVIQPIMVSAIIAGFLLLMVAFGIFGVLWQNVTRRTGELGLRRALGAPRQSIFRQIVAETLLVATLALGAGTLLALQLPLLGTFRTIQWETALAGITMGALLIFSVCVVCSVYPAYLAARRSPADALRYE